MLTTGYRTVLIHIHWSENIFPSRSQSFIFFIVLKPDTKCSFNICEKYLKDDVDLDNGWKEECRKLGGSLLGPYLLHMESFGPLTCPLSLTYGVCPSSCISSTYMNIASHNLVACARHNVPSWSEAMYMVEASNKEEDSTHC